MNATPEDGLKHGQGQVQRLSSAGIDTKDGLLLDIGCGWGRLAYGLLSAGFAGRYVGVDITAHRIEWLNENFASVQPNYRFIFDDVKNDKYNPDGSKASSDYSAMLEGKTADTVLLLSVFTHMYEQDIRSHLENIRDVMSPASTLLATCFLFDGIAAQGIAEGRAHRTFRWELSEHCRYDRKNNPLGAIAYTEPLIEKLVHEAGFTATIHRGSWSGMLDGPLPQDTIIARLG